MSPNGKEAISINFSRLRASRDSYGYAGNGQESKINKAYPKDDGLFLVNLENGVAKLIVSIQDIKKYVPELKELDKKEIHDPVEKVRTHLNYPSQILDLKQSRLRAIEAFNSAKN